MIQAECFLLRQNCSVTIHDGVDMLLGFPEPMSFITYDAYIDILVNNDDTKIQKIGDEYQVIIFDIYYGKGKIRNIAYMRAQEQIHFDQLIQLKEPQK